MLQLLEYSRGEKKEWGEKSKCEEESKSKQVHKSSSPGKGQVLFKHLTLKVLTLSFDTLFCPVVVMMKTFC